MVQEERDMEEINVLENVQSVYAGLRMASNMERDELRKVLLADIMSTAVSMNDKSIWIYSGWVAIAIDIFAQKQTETFINPFDRFISLMLVLANTLNWVLNFG